MAAAGVIKRKGPFKSDNKKKLIFVRQQLCLVRFACFILVVVMVHSATGLQQHFPISQWKSHSIITTQKTTTAQKMVLRIPEFIIEQESTDLLLDMIIDENVQTKARRPIMMPFNPARGWIWQRWKGTVFSETWKDCIRNMIYAVGVVLLLQYNVPFHSCIIIQKDHFHHHFDGFSILWGQIFSVTTFTLIFFVNESYALWRKCYRLSRGIQGRFNDIGMLLATHAARETKRASSSTSSSSSSLWNHNTSTNTNNNESYKNTYYTTAARRLLVLIARYVRLFNLLMYASYTRSHRTILTRRGMYRLVKRGLLTAKERDILIIASKDNKIPATQRHCCVLMWIVRAFVEGRMAGHFVGGPGLEQEFLDLCHRILAQCGAISGSLQGRMPLAYAHIVQVLVDFVLLMYPVMALTSSISPVLGVIGTGLLTMFYQGLFDLAKQFLDPYDNESYGKGEDTLCVETFIAESNAASILWVLGLAEMPVSIECCEDDVSSGRRGELYLDHHQLPISGYSVAELQQMEKERKRKQQEFQKKQTQILEEEEEQVMGQVEEDEDKISHREAKEQSLVVMDDTRNDTTAIVNTSASHFYLPDSTIISLELDHNSLEESSGIGSNRTKKWYTETTMAENQTNLIEDIHNITSFEGGAPVAFAAVGVSPHEEREPKDGDTHNTIVSNDTLIGSTRLWDGGGGTVSSTVNKSLNSNRPDKAIASVVIINKNPDLSSNKHMEGDTNNPLHSYLHQHHERRKISSSDELAARTALYSDLPWHDEKGPDGKGYRLSQMLADEVWEEQEHEQEQQNSVVLKGVLEDHNDDEQLAANNLKATKNELREQS